MQLVEVDAIDVELAEASFGGLADVRGAGPALALSHGAAELCRDQDPVPTTLQGLAEPFLAREVAVGGVEEVDPRFDRPVHHGAHGVRLHAEPEVVGSEPDDGHVETSDLLGLHMALSITERAGASRAGDPRR